MNTEPAAATVLRQLLDERYSCRAFRAEPVPTPVIHTLFGMAQRTPSWCNVQPWQADLLSGDVIRDFGAALSDHVRGGAAESSDLPIPAGYAGKYQDRRREAGHALYASVGIERSDHEARAEQMMRNFRFFGAPHTAVITTDREIGVYGAVDCGAYVAALLLAAHSLDLAAIAQGAVGMYSGFVREYLDLPEDRLVVCAVSFGYADSEHPINGFRTSRAEVDAVLRHVGTAGT